MTSLAAWYALLVIHGVGDVLLTHVGLQRIPGSREVNPLAAAALEMGLTEALFVKLLALAGVAVVVLILRRALWGKAARRLLAFWVFVFTCLNAYSLTLLYHAGVVG